MAAVSYVKRRMWIPKRGYATALVDDSELGNKYVYLFKNLMSEFHKTRDVPDFIEELPADAPIDFIFDDQTEKAKIVPAWDDFVASHDPNVRRRFGSTPRFESDQKFLPLQAADLWAGYVRSKITSIRPGDRLEFDSLDLGSGTFPAMAVAIVDANTIADDLRRILHRKFPGEPVYQSF